MASNQIFCRGRWRIVTLFTRQKQEKPVMEKTEIEIELSEVIAYSSRDERFESFCIECDETVEVATVNTASILCHLSELEVYRLVQSGEVHFNEAGRLLVCLRSLTRVREAKAEG
jgi:hypothetical protein